MQAKKLTVILMAGMVAFVGLSPSIGLCGDEEVKAKFYESCIVKEIAACEKKAYLIDSRSRNLREYAQVKVQKAAFLVDRKDSLIEELVEMQTALRDHSVRVYLNSRFYEKLD